MANMDVNKASHWPVNKEIQENVVSNEKESIDPFLIKWAEPTDPLNPKDWSVKTKWVMVAVLSATGFNRIMDSTIMAPALPTIAEELDMSSVESALALSIFILATAVGPLVIGPLSEVYGRAGLIHLTNIWFLIWNLVCGFSYSKGLLIASRFLAGFGASAVFSLGYAVLADVFRPEQRGISNALYSLVPLVGAALGPILGGFITAYSTWRWMFWSTSIFQAVLAAISIPIFKETHAPTILSRKANIIRRETGDDRYHTDKEAQRKSHSKFYVLQRNLLRPYRLLIFHPMIQIQSFMAAYNYGVLYLVLSSFAQLFTTQYHEPIQISGLHYIALTIGEVSSSQLSGIYTDWVYRHLKARSHGHVTAEYRIPVMLPGAIITPIGLLVYGWAAAKNYHWIVVDIGGAITHFGLQNTYNCLSSYTMDSYPNHVGSATAAVQLFRSLAAFGFPLFAPGMYASLGYGWGNSLLAFVAIAIGIPLPLLLWRYGGAIRARERPSE